MTIKLSERAVLANLKVSRWGYFRHDTQATTEIHTAKNAGRKAGNYNKRLLPTSATGNIETVIQDARNYHRFNTLPWLDDGVRMLPAAKYMDYAENMKRHQESFDEAVRAFVKEYPKNVDLAAKYLGKLFNKADYPAPAQVERQFKMQTIILPFPDASDFRVDISNSVKSDLNERMDQVMEEALIDVGERISEVVGRMSEKLKAYKPAGKKKGDKAEGTFRDSLVENVRELVQVLPGLNLTNDKKLDGIIAKMTKSLCQNDADALREDEALRAATAKSADDILSALSAFIA